MDTKNLKEKFKNNKKTYYTDQFMTIQVNGMFGTPSVIYCGDSELEAYKRFKSLEGQARKIVKADVTFVYVLDTDMIEKYEVKEVIEDEE
ncbi:hypothetical protein HMPREF1092_01234 [Clostridium thermobutyricum]|uniref:Uncharacterized protein n=1 Tax=Clostridium thermobutyricum TaxID=29372 RepID=N9Y1G9_9CLOT|nr:hypothetical protein [Clostridium thermobutyricum]ENZ01999.1 hypothetical protein HMPREF1092_01234 [Clostridium thermobutyricum]